MVNLVRIEWIVCEDTHTSAEHGMEPLIFNRILNDLYVFRNERMANVRTLRALENFFLGSYFMYTQFYFHKVVRILSSELISEMFGDNYFKAMGHYFSLTNSHVGAKALNYSDNIRIEHVSQRKHFREMSEDEGVFQDVKAFLLFIEDKPRFDACKKKITDKYVHTVKSDKSLFIREVSQSPKNVGEIGLCTTYADKSIRQEVKKCLLSPEM